MSNLYFALRSSKPSQSIRLIICLLVCVVVAPTTVAAAGDREARHQNIDGTGYAIHGYDPVAYFLDGKAVKGSKKFVATYKGANYAFVSEKNRQSFRQDPENFAPQYGGYCAYGIVHGSKSAIDPHVWKIVEGRLYFMINPGTMSIWKKREKLHIKIANGAWRIMTKQSAKK